MCNALGGLRPIQNRFDMKGSTYKRLASKQERQKAHPVFKDQARAVTAAAGVARRLRRGFAQFRVLSRALCFSSADPPSHRAPSISWVQQGMVAARGGSGKGW